MRSPTSRRPPSPNFAISKQRCRRAMELRGARYLHVLVPCPLGWGSASSETIEIARLAKETGIFPVFEARDGELTAVSEIRRRRPGRGLPASPEALRAPVQARVAQRRDRADPGQRRPQHPPLQVGGMMDKPFAITLDVGSSLANHTGVVARRSAPSTSTACRRATMPVRPARTSSNGCTTRRQATTRRPGASSSRTTRCRP